MRELDKHLKEEQEQLRQEVDSESDMEPFIEGITEHGDK